MFPSADSATLPPNPPLTDLAAAGQLRALLRPGAARAGEHPRRPRRRRLSFEPPIRAVFPSADNATLVAEVAGADLAGAGQLRALLRPGRARAREHPRRPDEAVVDRAADQGGVPVRRQRHARSRSCAVGRSRRCRSASAPCCVQVRARAGEHPRRPIAGVVGRSRRSARCSRPPTTPRSSRTRPAPVSPLPVSFAPCCVQVPPERVNTHAAPTSLLSPGRRSGRCSRPPTAPRSSRSGRRRLAAAGQLRALLRPGAPERVNTHAAPTSPLSGAADRARVPVGRQRHAGRRTSRRRARRPTISFVALLDQRVEHELVARGANEPGRVGGAAERSDGGHERQARQQAGQTEPRRCPGALRRRPRRAGHGLRSTSGVIASSPSTDGRHCVPALSQESSLVVADVTKQRAAASIDGAGGVSRNPLRDRARPRCRCPGRGDTHREAPTEGRHAMWDDRTLERCVARELEWDRRGSTPAGIRVGVRAGIARSAARCRAMTSARTR